MSLRKLSRNSIKSKIERALKLQERGKVCYSKAEQLIRQVGMRSTAGELIDVSDGKTGTLYVVVDQFAESIESGEEIVWAHAATHRWKLRKVSKRTSEAMRANA